MACTRPAGGLVHEALFYGSDAELLDFAVPYLRAGLDAGEHTGVFGDDRILAMLATALGRDSRPALLPQFAADARPARTYSMCSDLTARQVAAGATRLRLLGRPNFSGTPQQRARWRCYESVLNHALDGAPVTAVCLYDTRSDPPEVLDAGLQTHPRITTAAGYGPNPAFVPPQELLARPLAPAPARTPDVRLDAVRDPSAARRAVTAAVLAGRGPTEEREDFVTALTEVLFNADRHGRPPVDVRLWVSSTELFGEVTDAGPGLDDRLLGFRPLRPGDLREGPLGLWLARRLCDDLDYARTESGFTVRLRTYLTARQS